MHGYKKYSAQHTFGHIPNGTDKIFIGAGILVYEKIKDDYLILLGKDKIYEQYTAMDGCLKKKHVNKCNALQLTAQHEIFEESVGIVYLRLMDIDQGNNYVDISGHLGGENMGKYYRIYIIRVPKNKITARQCKDHIKIASGEGYDTSLRETVALDKFSLKNLLLSGILQATGDFATTTITGEYVVIYERTVDVIKKVCKKNIFVRQNKIINIISHEKSMRILLAMKKLAL